MTMHGFSTRTFVPVSDLPSITPGRDRSDLARAMWEAAFTPGSGITPRKAYQATTGDLRVTGRLSDCDPVLMREALGSDSWPNVLGDAVSRRVVAEYRKGTRYAVWRKLANIGNVADFRPQYRVRWGGYGDLPIVAEKDPYLALASPTDEVASYTLQKRGGTEQITLEMVRNDDVQVVQAIPRRLAEAADRTLSHFVLDFPRLNPLVYDGVPLFDGAHGNLGSSELSAAGVAAARAVMKAQTEPGSADPLGIGPRYLLVPFALEEIAFNVFRRTQNIDRTHLQESAIEPVVVWYWTDADDWVLSADPADVPGIEVGFLDGRDEPEVFAQDSPTSGSMFSNDQLTLKIRHIYSGCVTDYRGWYKSVPA
jgi:hypothetical protein